MMRLELTDRQLNWMFIIFCTFAFFMLGAGDALAQTCTSDPDMQANSAAGGGIVSAVMQTIISLLDNTSETLYEEVINDSEFKAARNAVLLLAISIYGVMIIFNIANFKPGEIVGVLFKVGLIMMLTEGAAWSFFNGFIGDFFFGTMIEMIEIFMGKAAGAASSGYVGQSGISTRLTEPLTVFNWPMARIISTQFFITVLGVLVLVKYGLILAPLLIWAAFNLLMALLSALFTYTKSIVGLWFLFALAPIFFLLLLFRRTQNLFEGWINMVISFTLQPILLFAFLSFFLTMTTASLGDMMNSVNWCWMPVDGKASGTSSEWFWWIPVNINGTPIEGGIWGAFGNLDKTGKAIGVPFPIDTMDVMFFLLSSYIGWQYAKFVPSLATELSSCGLRLSVNAEAVRNYFSSRGWTPGQVSTKAASSLWNWR